MIFFKKKMFPRPSNPPDELAQHVSKKNPFRTNYSSIFSAKVQNLAVFSFIYMIRIRFFEAAGINSEIFSARTVYLWLYLRLWLRVVCGTCGRLWVSGVCLWVCVRVCVCGCGNYKFNYNYIF